MRTISEAIALSQPNPQFHSLPGSGSKCEPAAARLKTPMTSEDESERRCPEVKSREITKVAFRGLAV
jgi:hypothetical protein